MSRSTCWAERLPCKLPTNRQSIGWRLMAVAVCWRRCRRDLLPGSEIANLSVLGYDVPKVFEGRGSLEAASMGIPIEEGEMAMRCNLITIEDGKIKNHSAGHISNEEAAQLIEFLQQELGGGDVNFFPGVSYRHLLKLKGGSKRIITTPPHDVPGTPYKEVLVRPADASGEATAKRLNELIERSQELLANHPVNLARKVQGKDPANSIWPWSPGYRPQMGDPHEPLWNQERCGDFSGRSDQGNRCLCGSHPD